MVKIAPEISPEAGRRWCILVYPSPPAQKNPLCVRPTTQAEKNTLSLDLHQLSAQFVSIVTPSKWNQLPLLPSPWPPEGTTLFSPTHLASSAHLHKGIEIWGETLTHKGPVTGCSLSYQHATLSHLFLSTQGHKHSLAVFLPPHISFILYSFTHRTVCL